MKGQRQRMTEEEKKAGNRKKWAVAAGTIAVLAIVFTWISWKSMHPAKVVTMEEMETYADEELINDIECINGSYVALIYDEQEQGSEWYALESTDADKPQVEKLAERADVQIKEENISPPVIFIMYMIQFSICYGIVWGIWKLYGKFRIGKRRERYRF